MGKWIPYLAFSGKFEKLKGPVSTFTVRNLKEQTTQATAEIKFPNYKTYPQINIYSTCDSGIHMWNLADPKFVRCVDSRWLTHGRRLERLWRYPCDSTYR